MNDKISQLEAHIINGYVDGRFIDEPERGLFVKELLVLIQALKE